MQKIFTNLGQRGLKPKSVQIMQLNAIVQFSVRWGASEDQQPCFKVKYMLLS